MTTINLILVNNRILFIGGLGEHMNTLDETVMFNKLTQSWDTVGHLSLAISAHAASVVSLEDVIQHCN